MNTEELCTSAWAARILGPRLEDWAARQAERPLLRCENGWQSWAEVEQASRRIAAGLQALGVTRGDRVALIASTRDALVLSFLAIGRIGAIAVPLNSFLRGEFLRFQLADAAAATVMVDTPGLDSVAAVADELPELERVVAFDALPQARPALPDRVGLHAYAALAATDAAGFTPPALTMEDPLALIYTSGTTGLPKGCICSHGYFMASSIPCLEKDWIRHDDVLFTPFPLFHIAGLGLMLGGVLQAGASICFDLAFSASSFIQRVNEIGATVAHGVGPMGMAILATPESPLDRGHKLRLCTWPPMSAENQQRFEQRFGVEVHCGGYGQSESVPLATMSAAEARHKRTALGRPTPHMEVRIVDEHDQPVAPGQTGEIVARPLRPQIMYQGYWRRPDATVEASRNLWHHTGDLGRADEDGYLYFVDRKKDAMRRRGENVSSYELEQAILKHGGFAAVAAHAVPSELVEDDIKVCVVLRPGVSPTPEDLFAFFKKNLPYFAVPRYVEVMEALPTNANGRVMKHKLRERGIGEAWDFEALGLRVEKHERRG
jgi:carnitine-CoA ligase